jgi:hypothetical protein
MSLLDKIKLIGENVHIGIYNQLALSRALFPLNLSGSCGIASFILFKKLEELKIKSKIAYGFYNGQYHCWIVKGKYNIDPTATQFGLKSKVLISKSKKYEFWHFVDDFSFFNKWKYFQNPLNYEISWNENYPIINCNFGEKI